MSTRLRVLHVVSWMSPLRGGTTSSVLEMIQALAAADVSSEIVTTDDDGPGRRLTLDAPERRLPGRHYVRKTFNFYNFAWDLPQCLRRLVPEFDIVHIHGLFSYANGVAGRIARDCGIPYVVTPHGMANRYGMAHKPIRKRLSFALVERSLLEGASTIHMTSGTEADEFGLLSVSAPVSVVPLPVSPSVAGCASRFFQRWPELRGRSVALFVGRLDPIKNLENLIGAMMILAASRPDVVLVIAGDGEATYAAKLRALANGRNVHFAGFLRGSDKADALAAASVFVLPSLSESFGMAAIEALGAGLPLILGRNIATGRELADKGFAELVEPSPIDIADGIRRALDRLPHWNRVSGINYVVLNYAPASFASAMREIYRARIRA